MIPPYVIKDVWDGECSRRSVFFNQHPEAVPLIVFIDELEVCNPTFLHWTFSLL